MNIISFRRKQQPEKSLIKENTFPRFISTFVSLISEELIGYRGEFLLSCESIYIVNSENLHMHSLGMELQGIPNCILWEQFQFSCVHVLLNKYSCAVLYRKVCFSQASALKISFSFCNKWDSWCARIVRLCSFLCPVLNGIEANDQTTMMSIPFFTHSTWLHLRKLVQLAELQEKLFSEQMAALGLITFQTDLQ